MLKNWNNLTLDERNDLVFEGRNQNYGAYQLRTTYNKRVSMIVGGMIVFSIALFGVKKFIDRPHEEEVVETLKVEQIDLTPPPPIEETPPPPPPPPPPPMVEMVKFTPPVIKDDAVEEEPQKLQEEVKETQVGEKDQEGDKDIIAPPTENTGPGEPTAPEIFAVVEEMPEPPGGISSFYNYVKTHIVYPQMEKEAGISGKVFLKFVVEMDGSLSDVQVLKGVSGCSACDKEAVRVLKTFPEKWKPGRQNGHTARVYYTLPIVFKVQ
ncbi:MAG TPA: TonB family protein [Bacteroidia bacterium]|nr:TonB family protein [Bacteroidia bacterium]